MDNLVVIRGGGDLATGVAHRLFSARFPVVITELPVPQAVRRAVSFAEAVLRGVWSVEGITARLTTVDQVERILRQCEIPLLIDPEGETIPLLRPKVVVDAIMAKENPGTRRGMAPVVIGLGPGFTAGVDVDAVIETKRGHFLGRVIYQGQAEPNTGIPGEVQGVSAERVLRSPHPGMLRGVKKIGDLVKLSEIVAYVDETPVAAAMSGVVRGLLADQRIEHPGYKIGDIDPRGDKRYCFTISDKARAIGGGVLEAILHLSGLLPASHL